MSLFNMLSTTQSQRRDRSLLGSHTCVYQCSICIIVCIHNQKNIHYPSYTEIQELVKKTELRTILECERSLLFSQTTIPMCDEAIEEVESVVNSVNSVSDLNDTILIRLLILCRGQRYALNSMTSSEYEDPNERSLNVHQLIKAYQHGEKELQKQLQEFYREKQNEIVSTPSIKNPHRQASNDLKKKLKSIHFSQENESESCSETSKSDLDSESSVEIEENSKRRKVVNQVFIIYKYHVD